MRHGAVAWGECKAVHHINGHLRTKFSCIVQMCTGLFLIKNKTQRKNNCRRPFRPFKYSIMPLLSLVEILPQDLIDRLIDTLRSSSSDWFSERDHLQTCALLCRPFLPRSQHHLFSSIKLTADRVHDFYEILRRTPSIARAVHTLHLVFYEGRCDWMLDGRGAEFVYIMTSITQPTTSTSTMLCKLKLEGQRPSGSSIKNPQLFLERVIKPFLAQFITSLHIETLSNVPINIIDSCVGLTELELVCASFKYGHTHTHIQSSLPQHKLRKIEYTDSNQVKRLTMAESQTRPRLDLSELRSLCAHIDSWNEATFEQWIIDESAGALEELCFENFEDPREFLVAYNGDSIFQLTAIS